MRFVVLGVSLVPGGGVTDLASGSLYGTGDYAMYKIGCRIIDSVLRVRGRDVRWLWAGHLCVVYRVVRRSPVQSCRFAWAFVQVALWIGAGEAVRAAGLRLMRHNV